MGNCKCVRLIARGNKVCDCYVLESHVHCLWLGLQAYLVWHMVGLLQSYSMLGCTHATSLSANSSLAPILTQALTPIFSLHRDPLFRGTVLGNSTSWLVEHHKDTISAESHVLGGLAPDHIGMWSAGEAPAIFSRVAEERTFKEDFSSKVGAVLALSLVLLLLLEI